MPHNAVLDTSFSDTQTRTPTEGGLQTFVFPAEGGETSFQNDLLINASVKTLTRDGLTYSPVETFSVTTKKEYKHYPVEDADTSIAAGTIISHPGLPPMEQSEDSFVQYVADGDLPSEVTEPITLQEAKNWLKIEVSDDDSLIEALIIAARQACEGYTALSFVEREVTAILKNELGNIRLPYGPVNEIISMHDAYDEEIIEDNYTVRGDTVKYILSPLSCWLKVTYNAGYSVLPKQFKTAVLMQIAWLYQHRGDAMDNDALSPDAKILLKPYRAIV